MGDWDFLHEMHDEGYSPQDIEEAATSGATPRQWVEIKKQELKTEWDQLKVLRDTGQISAEEFKKRKAEIFQ